MTIAKGSTGALNTLFKFAKETGSEPEEIYFRYYLRLADDWNQTLQGGKMPGISGTYGVAGWGGRKSRRHERLVGPRLVPADRSPPTIRWAACTRSAPTATTPT